MQFSRFSYYCFVLTSACILIGGISYLACPTVMPYHKQAMGLEWSQLNDGLKILLISSVKGLAAGAINTAIACFALLFFMKDHPFSKYFLLVLSIIWLVPLMLMALWISSVTGADTPWYMPTVLLIIVFTGFGFSFRKP